MKDYLSVRGWNHITFSFCEITILKNKAILWSGWRFKIWVKPLPQTDICFSGLDQVTYQSLYHPYKTPLNPHIYVKKYEYQLPWDTDKEGRRIPAKQKGSVWGTSMHRQTYGRTEKPQRNKTETARFPWSGTHRLLSAQSQTPQLPAPVCGISDIMDSNI